jgi:hypothetical protein
MFMPQLHFCAAALQVPPPLQGRPSVPEAPQLKQKWSLERQTAVGEGQVPGGPSQEQCSEKALKRKLHDSACTPSLQTLSRPLTPGTRQVEPPQVTVALPQVPKQLETQELALWQ